ncbi:hypothetical protein RFI_23754 [Reticulomyxa filosa]|uniref:Uncharacterized protein n=1 Tax=Reticulomyxa filosa TaxID=46433 RepID=X6MIA7_RETFI|nr:hypothetical protein RFI_23754 [Reticulomyxa filosa]|eukprot:ETO13614.1 hypothetical protein RFI_23754 [Reticulomyxa filosa]
MCMTGTDLVCEVQFHHNVFYQYKKESHYVYKRARLFESGDRNLAYEYVTKHIKDKVSKNEKYIPHEEVDHDHAEENDEKEEGKETEGHTREGEKKVDEKTVEELVKEWMPPQAAKQCYDALAEHGYDTLEMLELIANTEEETLNELTKTMGFKAGHAKLFVKRRDEYFQSIRNKEKQKQQEKEQLKQNWNDKVQKDKESAMAEEVAKKTKEFDSAYNRFLVASAFITGQTEKTFKCTWFGKNPYRWINSDWEAAPLSTQGSGLPERFELEEKTLKVFSIICQFRVSKCREGAHHSSFLSFENFTMIKGDDFYEFDSVDNKFHNLVISVDLNKGKFWFMLGSKTKFKELQITVPGGVLNPHVLYIGCHIHRGFNNVYKRMDGEIANVRIYSIPFDTALMETALEFYKAVKPPTQ